MNKGTWAGLLIALLVLGGTTAWWWYGRVAPPPPARQEVREEIPSPSEEGPRVRYPLPAMEQEDAPEPLPELDDSDAELGKSLSEVFGKEPVESLLIPDRLVRNFVATIDSLDRDPVRLKLRPVSRPDGPVLVATEGERISLSPANAERYAPFVSALQAVEPKALARVYLRYYPLFQKAYEELGYPDRYFNDRLIEIINHLLAAPDVEGPLRLERPKVLYVFADENLEALSWGQKTLIRIGPDNAAAVKQTLRALRAAIAELSADALAAPGPPKPSPPVAEAQPPAEE